MNPARLARYRPYHQKFTVPIADRRWPDRVLTTAPQWCSVDLRDGNQALPTPMTIAEKLEFFRLLVEVGFRQIEVGFPSASDTEFRFMRRLIETAAVPAGVAVQVLVQAREHLIERTFESLAGFPHSIVHLYNSTSRLQRRVTFGGASQEKIRQIAVDGAQLIRQRATEAENRAGANGEAPPRVDFQYSPESFSDTEVDFAYEVCRSVLEVWGPTPERPIILNLPVTVEWTTPNVHADQIEWFCRQLEADGLRDRVIVSLHTHNDRGTGIACTELGLLAGADRVEGTLFGNGERTGNLDIVTVALNMNSHGIATGLDFSDLPRIRAAYERITRLEVPPRQPYAGDLVFTAFSGSHQDAIKKGMDLLADKGSEMAFEVPYLTIDPQDIGRTYEAIIRFNSQSGKGGAAWMLQREGGYDLPKLMAPQVGGFVGAVADEQSRELTPTEIRAIFEAEFVNREEPLRFGGVYELVHDPATKRVRCDTEVTIDGVLMTISGEGNGPISAFVKALENAGLKDFNLTHYSSHAIGTGSGSDCAAYVSVRRLSGGHADATGSQSAMPPAPQVSPSSGGSGDEFWGCGVDPSIEIAGLKALVTAINRSRSRAKIVA